MRWHCACLAGCAGRGAALLLFTQPGRNPPLPFSLACPQVKFALQQAHKAAKDAPGLEALLPGEAELAGLLGFRLGGISQAVYVDASGKQHPVAPQVGWGVGGRALPPQAHHDAVPQPLRAPGQLGQPPSDVQ